MENDESSLPTGLEDRYQAIFEQYSLHVEYREPDWKFSVRLASQIPTQGYVITLDTSEESTSAEEAMMRAEAALKGLLPGGHPPIKLAWTKNPAIK